MDTFALCGADATGYNTTSYQHCQVSTYSGKKAEVPREKLTDHEFDKIVLETSARLASSAVRASECAFAAASAGCDDVKDFTLTQGPVSPPLWSPLPSQGPLKLSHPKRPMNAFMVWGQAIRRELHNRFSNVQNALLSKALGRVWKRLDLDEKEPYISRANIIKTTHKRDYPNYRYQPRRIQEKNQQQQVQQHQQHRRIHSTKLNQHHKQNNHLAQNSFVGLASSFDSSQSQATELTTNRHQYYQQQQQQQQPNQQLYLQTHQSHSHSNPMAPIIAEAPKITHHHATISNNFMSCPPLNGNNQQASVPADCQPACARAYKSGQYDGTTNSMQSPNINSSNLYAAGSIPAPTIGTEEATTSYSIYDSSPRYVSSSEASNDYQHHFINSKDLTPVTTDGGGLPFNTTDQQQHQQQPKLFIDTTAGHGNFETSQQQHVYPVQCQTTQNDHVHRERQNHSQLTENNNNHDLSREPITNIIPQQSNGSNSFEYQFYRQQHQHHNNSQQQQQQQRQQIEQFEDSSQSYRGYAEQVQSYPLDVCDTHPVVNGKPQIITQTQIVTEYAADQGGCQMKRGNYHHMYRGCSDELSFV